MSYYSSTMAFSFFTGAWNCHIEFIDSKKLAGCTNSKNVTNCLPDNPVVVGVWWTRSVSAQTGLASSNSSAYSKSQTSIFMPANLQDLEWEFFSHSTKKKGTNIKIEIISYTQWACHDEQLCGWSAEERGILSSQYTWAFAAASKKRWKTKSPKFRRSI